MEGDPNGRPGRVVAGDLEISVRVPRCDLRKPFGTFSGLGGLSRVDQPPLRAVFTRPEAEVYTLRRKGDLEGIWTLRAKTRQDLVHRARVCTDAATHL